MISKEDVIKVSKLVNIKLPDEEVSKLSVLFSDTLDKINILKELDVNNVNETYQVNGLTNVFSDPEQNKTTLTQEEALKNAPKKSKGYFATKAVFER